MALELWLFDGRIKVISRHMAAMLDCMAASLLCDGRIAARGWGAKTGRLARGGSPHHVLSEFQRYGSCPFPVVYMVEGERYGPLSLVSGPEGSEL